MADATTTGILTKPSSSGVKDVLTATVDNVYTAAILNPQIQSKVQELSQAITDLRSTNVNSELITDSGSLDPQVESKLQRVVALDTEIKNLHRVEGIAYSPVLAMNTQAVSDKDKLEGIFNTSPFLETEEDISNNLRSEALSNVDTDKVLADIAKALKDRKASDVVNSNIGLYEQLNDIRTLEGLSSSDSESVKETVYVNESRDSSTLPVSPQYSGPSAPKDPDFVGPIDERHGADQEVFREAKSFYIKYSNVEGETKFFSFSLLPAIETTLRGNNFGQSVPEVKPGILVNTKLNLKKFNVPGGTSVYQSLGIDQTIMQMTGLFIGAEGDDLVSPEDALYGAMGPVGFSTYQPNPINPLANKQYNAVKTANSFFESVVLSGSPVEIFVRSQDIKNTAIVIENKVLIQDFRILSARHDRVYYSINAVVIDTPTQRLRSSILLNGGTRPEEISNPEKPTAETTETVETTEEGETNSIPMSELVKEAIEYGIVEDGISVLTPDQIGAVIERLEEEGAI